MKENQRYFREPRKDPISMANCLVKLKTMILLIFKVIRMTFKTRTNQILKTVKVFLGCHLVLQYIPLTTKMIRLKIKEHQ